MLPITHLALHGGVKPGRIQAGAALKNLGSGSAAAAAAAFKHNRAHLLARSASRAVISRVCASPGPAAVSGAGSASVARLRPFFAMLPASVDARLQNKRIQSVWHSL